MGYHFQYREFGDRVSCMGPGRPYKLTVGHQLPEKVQWYYTYHCKLLIHVSSITDLFHKFLCITYVRQSYTIHEIYRPRSYKNSHIENTFHTQGLLRLLYTATKKDICHARISVIHQSLVKPFPWSNRATDMKPLDKMWSCTYHRIWSWTNIKFNAKVNIPFSIE